MSLGRGRLIALAIAQKLKSIRLSGKKTPLRLGDNDLAQLAAIKSLRALFVDFLPVRDAGIASFSQHPNMRELGLAGTQITDSALSYLASIPNLKKLRVANTTVTGRGLQALEVHPEIQDIDLSGCQNLEQKSLASIGKILSSKT